MKILLVSTSAILTPPEAYGGMERCAHWLAMGLNALGHEVKILAKIGSTTPRLAGEGTNELEFVELARGLQGQFDIIIDCSHDKLVSRSFPNFPQINNHQVMVLQWHTNPVFISKAQRHHIGREAAPVIYYGLNVEEYPFYEGPRDDYLLYLGSWIAEKRVHWVAELAQRLDLPAKIAGVGWQPEYWPTLEAMKKVPGVECTVSRSRHIEQLNRKTPCEGSLSIPSPGLRATARSASSSMTKATWQTAISRCRS